MSPKRYFKDISILITEIGASILTISKTILTISKTNPNQPPTPPPPPQPNIGKGKGKHKHKFHCPTIWKLTLHEMILLLWTLCFLYDYYINENFIWLKTKIHIKKKKKTKTKTKQNKISIPSWRKKMRGYLPGQNVIKKNHVTSSWWEFFFFLRGE